MESFGRCCSLSWHRIRPSVPSRKRRYSTPYWHKIVTKKKVRFIYHENWRKRNKIEERNADAKPTDNTTGNGKAKISGRFQCQDNQSWPLFSLEFGSAFSTTDKRWKKKEPSETLRSVVRFPGAGLNSFCYWWQNNQTATKTRKKIDHKKTGAIGYSYEMAQKSGQEWIEKGLSVYLRPTIKEFD